MSRSPIFERIAIWRGKHTTEQQFIIILSIVVGLLSGLAAVLLKKYHLFHPSFFIQAP